LYKQLIDSLCSLWKKACVAYGDQLVVNENSLAAIPYYLAVNDVDACINHLCESKHFREAWIIAKMRKNDEDPVFGSVMKKWIEYYDYSGNYEAAAALLVLQKDFKQATVLLAKRQNRSQMCTDIMELIASKDGQ